MFTPVQIINIGLSKLGTTRVRRVDPAGNSLEKFVAENWPHWIVSELAKHRWVFATERNVELTAEGVIADGDEMPYRYLLPVKVLRVLREQDSTWQQYGRYIHSANSTFKADMVMNQETEYLDPLFVEVLACRVAYESVEYITQSNTKKVPIKDMYRDAVTEAKKANAFVRGPEEVINDDDYPFLTDRFNPGY